MTIYCGVDFHVRSQTLAYCDSLLGEVHLQQLDHQKDDIRQFYARFTGEVIIGIEASGYSTWFEELLDSIGHQV